MIKFQQAYDRLSIAYLQGKVDPLMDCACFVGNLLQTAEWSWIRSFKEPFIQECGYPIPIRTRKNYEMPAYTIIAENGYTPDEIIDLEKEFLKVYISNHPDFDYDRLTNPIDEDALWLAFVSTLEVLKQIHIAKGEAVDQPVIFPKRVLQTA